MNGWSIEMSIGLLKILLFIKYFYAFKISYGPFAFVGFFAFFNSLRFNTEIILYMKTFKGEYFHVSKKKIYKKKYINL